jgi:hypothetical protein
MRSEDERIGISYTRSLVLPMVPRRRFPTTENEWRAHFHIPPQSAYTGVRVLEKALKTATSCHFSAHLQGRSFGSGQSLNRVRIRCSDVTLARPGDSKPKWHEAPPKLPLFFPRFVHYLKRASDEHERLTVRAPFKGKTVELVITPMREGAFVFPRRVCPSRRTVFFPVAREWCVLKDAPYLIVGLGVTVDLTVLPLN